MMHDNSITFATQKFMRRPESVRIGRIVCNLTDPEEDFFDIYPTVTTQPPTVSRFETDTPLHENEKTAEQKTFLLLLAAFLNSEGLNKRDLHVTDVQCTARRVYELNNSREQLLYASENRRMRRWLEEKVISGRKKVYLIVGYHTIIDPVISKTVASEPEAPSGPFIPVPTVGIGLHRIQNMQFNVRYGPTRRAMMEYDFSATGEFIWSIKYQRIPLKTWYVDEDSDILYPGQWEFIWPAHVDSDEEGGEEQIVQDERVAMGVEIEDGDDEEGILRLFEADLDDESEDYDLYEADEAGGVEDFIVLFDEDIGEDADSVGSDDLDYE
ncbi:hypothetical protein DFH27DRAFT_601802 [Peziza echinospora]|nr:hypothetical protein DFH27DRAFT_601802 [Peziza echinospora]